MLISASIKKLRYMTLYACNWLCLIYNSIPVQLIIWIHNVFKFDTVNSCKSSLGVIKSCIGFLLYLMCVCIWISIFWGVATSIECNGVKTLEFPYYINYINYSSWVKTIQTREMKHVKWFLRENILKKKYGFFHPKI